jgi:hypothetical protein
MYVYVCMYMYIYIYILRTRQEALGRLDETCAVYECPAAVETHALLHALHVQMVRACYCDGARVLQPLEPL